MIEDERVASRIRDWICKFAAGTFCRQFPSTNVGNFGVRWHSEATTALWIAFSRTEASNLQPQYPKRRRCLALPAHSKRKKINVKRVNC
jgi:hypothetical protein